MGKSVTMGKGWVSEDSVLQKLENSSDKSKEESQEQMNIKGWMIMNAFGITLRKLIFCFHGEMGREMPTQNSMQKSPLCPCEYL